MRRSSRLRRARVCSRTAGRANGEKDIRILARDAWREARRDRSLCIRAQALKHPMLEERVDARELFSHGEGIVTRNNAKLRESGRGSFRNRCARQRMRQGFYFRVVFERDMRGLVRPYEDKDESGCDSGGVNFVRSSLRVPVVRRIKDDEMTL